MATKTYYHVLPGGVHVSGRHFGEGVYNDQVLAKAVTQFPHRVEIVDADKAEKIIAGLKEKAEKAAAAARAKKAAPTKASFVAEDKGGAK